MFFNLMYAAAILTATTDQCNVAKYSGLKIPNSSKSYLYYSEPMRGSDLDYLIAQWRDVDSRLGTVYATYGNRAAAYLGNDQGEMLSSYLEMYQATKDSHFMNRFIEQADLVLADRDDKVGFRDYSGRIVKAWSTYAKNYVSPEWVNAKKAYAFLVESGQITYPMAEFARIVVKGPDCLKDAKDPKGRTYLSIAQGYIYAVEETLGYHNEMLHTDTKKGFKIAWYGARTDIGSGLIGIEAGREYPLNYQTSIGRTVASLWLATGRTSYRDLAVALGNFTLLEMEYKASGIYDWYEWNYWPQMTYYPGYVPASHTFSDDFGHASVVFEFACQMRKNVGVFYDTELSRFARTFTLRLVSTLSSRYRYLNRTDLRPSPELLTLDGSVLCLAPYDPSIELIVFDSLISYLQLHYGSKGTMSMKSYAQLIHHWSKRMRANGVKTN